MFDVMHPSAWNGWYTRVARLDAFEVMLRVRDVESSSCLELRTFRSAAPPAAGRLSTPHSATGDGGYGREGFPLVHYRV